MNLHYSFLLGQLYNIMKQNQQINHRNRLNNYYKYLIQKVDNDEPFEYFKVVANESPPASPSKRHSKAADSRIISYTDNKKDRYQSQKQVSKVQMPEGNTPRTLKLPPIARHSSMLQREESIGADWQKYYNVHNLCTVNIDESTIKLIEENHRKRKAKRSISINQQRTDA